jgi:hypothetical protein
VSFFIDNWMLIAVAFASGAMLVWPAVSRRAGAAGSLNPPTPCMLMNREKAVVVDVCEPEEFAAGHVVGAKNMPLAELEAKLPGAVKNKATAGDLVCATGARSNRGLAWPRSWATRRPNP